MALGYIAAFSETLALAVIAEKGLAPLVMAVAEEPEDHLKSATAWSLGQIGRHTPDHAKAVADTGGLWASQDCTDSATAAAVVCWHTSNMVLCWVPSLSSPACPTSSAPPDNNHHPHHEGMLLDICIVGTFELIDSLADPAGVLTTLVTLESHPSSSEDLTTKCRRALKSIVAKLTHLPALDALVHQQLPESVMRMVLEQVRVGRADNTKAALGLFVCSKHNSSGVVIVLTIMACAAGRVVVRLLFVSCCSLISSYVLDCQYMQSHWPPSTCCGCYVLTCVDCVYMCTGRQGVGK